MKAFRLSATGLTVNQWTLRISQFLSLKIVLGTRPSRGYMGTWGYCKSSLCRQLICLSPVSATPSSLWNPEWMNAEACLLLLCPANSLVQPPMIISVISVCFSSAVVYVYQLVILFISLHICESLHVQQRKPNLLLQMLGYLVEELTSSHVIILST